jgi:hypothetical protein
MNSRAAAAAELGSTWQSATNRLVYAGMAVSVFAAPLLSPDTVASGPVLCPFRRLTGVPCPGCGMTRSFVAVAHGDLGTAFAFNRLGPFMMTIFAIAILWKAVATFVETVPAPEVALARIRRRDYAGMAPPPSTQST